MNQVVPLPAGAHERGEDKRCEDTQANEEGVGPQWSAPLRGERTDVSHDGSPPPRAYPLSGYFWLPRSSEMIRSPTGSAAATESTFMRSQVAPGPAASPLGAEPPGERGGRFCPGSATFFHSAKRD